MKKNGATSITPGRPRLGSQEADDEVSNNGSEGDFFFRQGSNTIDENEEKEDILETQDGSRISSENDDENRDDMPINFDGVIPKQIVQASIKAYNQQWNNKTE